MTIKEEKSIEALNTNIRLLLENQNKALENLRVWQEDIEKKVDKSHQPANLEKDILKTAQESIAKAIETVLTGYNSPLTKLISGVIDEQSVFLRKIISESFDDVIRLPEFKSGVREAFSRKVARTIISNNEGLFDKVSNELKQSAEFKAKITIAVSNVVNECLKEGVK